MRHPPWDNIIPMNLPRAHQGSGLALDRYGVFGHPISHSLSPKIHAMFASATKQNLRYDRYDVAPGDFEREAHAFFERGGRGLNVTVPHKEIAAEWADDLTPRARQAGAVNTLSTLDDGRILGDNTDGAGFMADLARLGVDIRGRRVLILGAGGATRGLLAPLRDRQPATLVIANRNADRARELAGDQGCGYDDIGPFLAKGPFDLVVHATSMGLEGRVPPVDPRIIGPQTFAYDIGYSKSDTPFVSWAREAGAGGTAQGLGMLIEQAAESFFIWRGIRPDTAPVHQALAA